MQTIKDKIEEYLLEIDHQKAKDIISSIQMGKMLRSRLILSIASNSDTSVELCAIVEMIHLASLLHDDVIDISATRRGEASINAQYGNHTAIMLGDILYSLAFSKLTTLEPVIAQRLSRSVMLLSVGEFVDVELSHAINEDKELYLEMTYKKTSSLIEACAYCAGILAGKDATRLGEFGKNLGICFQLIDDMLDIFGEESKLGKPNFGDFKEGKTTLIYIFLLQYCNEIDRQFVINLFQKELTSSDKSTLLSMIDKYNIKEISKDFIKNFEDKAMALLLEDEIELQAILQKTITRDY